MQYLETLNLSKEASVYKLCGDFNDSLKRFIVSTPQSRAICNRPEILGCQYTTLMLVAMTATLKGLPFAKEILQKQDEESICILNFLRGGLNFDLRSALSLAFGFNRHRTSFMTSQRFKKDGRWGVKENAYRKFSFPPNATILIADVVATGVTIDNGLEVLVEHLKKTNASVKNLIFFTIGCHKIEKILEKYDAIFREFSPDFGNCYIVYFEGKFKLVDSKTELKIGIPGTDFVRFDSILAPEFELSQYESLNYPLERCTIYDAGSRAFDIPEYLSDVREYWTKLKKLAENGFTLYDALKERWPEEEYTDETTFVKSKKVVWKNIKNDLLEKIYQAYQKRWTDEFKSNSKNSPSLLELCGKRIGNL
ncbi:MAG: phosphoribosyltransferase [Pseudomonadota bacterium]